MAGLAGSLERREKEPGCLPTPLRSHLEPLCRSEMKTEPILCTATPKKRTIPKSVLQHAPPAPWLTLSAESVNDRSNARPLMAPSWVHEMRLGWSCS